MKLIAAQRAKATGQTLLWQPSCSPGGTLRTHGACSGLLSQPGVQGNTVAGTVSLRKYQFESWLAECKWTSEPCRPSFGLPPAAKDRLLGLCTAVVSLLLAELPALLIIFFSSLAHMEHCPGPSHATWGSSCNAFQVLLSQGEPAPSPKSPKWLLGW